MESEFTWYELENTQKYWQNRNHRLYSLQNHCEELVAIVKSLFIHKWKNLLTFDEKDVHRSVPMIDMPYNIERVLRKCAGLECSLFPKKKRKNSNNYNETYDGKVFSLNKSKFHEHHLLVIAAVIPQVLFLYIHALPMRIIGGRFFHLRKRNFIASLVAWTN